MQWCLVSMNKINFDVNHVIVQVLSALCWMNMIELDAPSLLNSCFAHFLIFTCIIISRTQKLAQEQNEKIETVNRERKYHQVIQLSVPSNFVSQFFAAFKYDK